MASFPNHIITVKGDESPYILLLRTTTRNTTSYLLLGTTTTPSPLTTIVRLRTTTNTTRQSHYFLPERKKKSWQPHLACSNKRKDAHTHTHRAATFPENEICLPPQRPSHNYRQRGKVSMVLPQHPQLYLLLLCLKTSCQPHPPLQRVEKYIKEKKKNIV